MKILYSLALVFNFYAIGAWSQCTLTAASDFSIKLPLLINNLSFVYPDERILASLNFAKNEVLEGYCPGSTLNISGTSTGTNIIKLTCSSGSKFQAPTTITDFRNIVCNGIPYSSIRQTGNCPNGRLIEIGFRIRRSTFIPVIDLCYNSNTGRTFWAHSVIPGAIRARQIFRFKPKFGKDLNGYFDEVPVVSAYTRASQRLFVLSIYGQNTTLRDRYISDIGSIFFVKSHLVPRCDMFYTAQQFSTFYYLNAQPMYDRINNGNWKIVENTVRYLATKIGDLDVWTGCLYNLELFYTPTEKRIIYLAYNKLRSTPVLVAPRLFFKIVYSRPTNQAIVFITANNPFLSSSHLPSDYQICSEYIACRNNNPRFNIVDKGLTFCCLYSDFMRDRLAASIGLPRLPNNTTPLI